MNETGGEKGGSRWDNDIVETVPGGFSVVVLFSQPVSQKPSCQSEAILPARALQVISSRAAFRHQELQWHPRPAPSALDNERQAGAGMGL